jgi:hypothetical protein
LSQGVQGQVALRARVVAGAFLSSPILRFAA